MPIIDIVVSELGYPETFSVVRWLAQDGAEVSWDQSIVEVENDKATYELPAHFPGRLRILQGEGRDLPINTVVGQLEVTDGVYAEFVRRQNLFSLTLRLTPAEWETLHRARGGQSVETYVHRVLKEDLGLHPPAVAEGV